MAEDPSATPMQPLSYGQPLGAITQVAFTVEDVESAIAGYVRDLGIGPWFLRGPFTPPQALYRGRPTGLSVSLAMAFSGQLMIELVQQHDDVPSIYNADGAQRRYGFHHFGVATGDFDGEVRRYGEAGFALVFSDITPVGTRIAYFDGAGRLPGMVELIEMNSVQESRYARIHAAAAGWDGRDPIRRM